jgi:hypothetical protein
MPIPVAGDTFRLDPIMLDRDYFHQAVLGDSWDIILGVKTSVN